MKGDIGDKFYIIVSGKVSIYIETQLPKNKGLTV